MKYDVLVTTSVDTLIRFESDKKYTKEQLREIVHNIMDEGKYLFSSDEAPEKLNTTIYWSVASGMDFSYSIDGEVQNETVD